MRIILFKTFDNTKFIDNMPEPFKTPKSDIEEKLYNPDDYWPLLTDDFLDKINTACKTCLDISDIEFFDTKQCKQLVSLLTRRTKESDSLISEFCRDLIHYAKAAIKLDTGIIVEL